ncbi:MAG: sodium-dependent bicarbonate transport family permease [Oxalobacteraceae bacterium]|jgi:hypothetical protein|nr:sodium-dependent bicarbonate transport family permease [Oxalobacteraceae bacterium]
MQNLLDPAILFFVFGIAAGLLRSNLEIPQSIAKFLSLYLLMALGLKGGFALASSGLSSSVLTSLFAALLMSVIVPALGYTFLKSRMSKFDAAAVAASYGSVSAVTFVTAIQYLESQNLFVGGHMAVAMVLMESPAIIMAVFLANLLRQNVSASVQVSGLGTGGAVLSGMDEPGRFPSIGKILHESFTNGAHLLLLASLLIGFASGETGKAMMSPFSSDLFKGMLAFFLLDMGLMVAKNLPGLEGKSPSLLIYGALGPLVHASIALGLAWLLNLPVADAVLLMVLSASASYIVVPAVLRYAIPEANPSVYFGLSLGVTFPLNILIGIPLYTFLAKAVMMP